VTVKAEVKPDAETLRRLSPLLDQVLDLEAPEREAWLAGLAGSDAELIPLLRKLLSPQSVRETGDILLHRPDCYASWAAAVWATSGWPSAPTVH
jgi:hypothetical protein